MYQNLSLDCGCFGYPNCKNLRVNVRSAKTVATDVLICELRVRTQSALCALVHYFMRQRR